MIEDRTDTEAGWDARQYFCREITYRIGKFLDINIDRKGLLLGVWMETLRDLFDLTRAWYKPDIDEDVENKLKEIHHLIWGKKNNFLDADKARNKLKAERDIRECFHICMKEIRRAGLLLPDKIKDDVDDINDQRKRK